MFGKFGFGFDNMNKPSESITKKLSEVNTTLEDLLKEEELLQEFRAQNKDLIKYFNKEKVKEMLNYIIKEQVDEQEKGYKFPFLCSQIFGLEIEDIMKYFFTTNKEMEELEKKEEKKEDDKNDNKEEKKDESEVKKEELPKEEDKKEESPKEEPPKEEPPKEEEKKEESPKEDKKEEEKPEEKQEVKPEEKQEEKAEEKPEEKPEEKGEEKQEEENNEENEEKSEEESKEDKIEVLDYLFENFFPEDESNKLNYVLSGYFSSLINNLLSMKPIVFLKYMYLVRNEYLNKMVDHFYRKSISDTLSKIIHFENYLQNLIEPLDEKTIEDMKDTRSYLLTDIFEKIDIDMENEDLNSIYYFITGLFDASNMKEEIPIFESIITNKKIIKSIITKPFHDLDLISFTNDEEHEKLLNRRKNFATLIDMILFFLKNIKKLKLEIPTNTSESKLTIKHTRISDELFIILKHLLQNNFIKKNENEKTQLQCFNDYQLKPLGEYKIKIIELLTHLVHYFKNISKFFDEILIEVDFFKVAFDYLLEYEWNNLYQEAFLNLLKTLLDNADLHQSLHQHLIEQIKILDLIKKHTTLDNLDKFIFTSTQDNNLKPEERDTLPIKRGYYSFFISLSYKLNTVMGGTPVNIEGGIPRQGSFAFMKRVPEEGDKKAAMDLLYGGFMEEPEDKNEEEQEQFSYKCMEEFINDPWREFFGLNIESVIKQFEDKNWPKQEKKPFDLAFYNNNDKEVDLLNDNNDVSDKDKNLFGDSNDLLGNYEDDKDEKNDRRGGVYEQAENNNNEEDNKNPFYDAIKEDNFNFENENDKNKENNMGDNNNFANVNEFEFGDDNKKEENKEDVKEEPKEEKAEEIKSEEVKEDKKEEVKEEKKEDVKEEKKEEKAEEIKPEEKKEEDKKENVEENQEKKTE